jgi:hypothetical protein
MTSALVTLEQAKLQLREDDDDLVDSDISMKAQQATDIVLDYLKAPDRGWTLETVPGEVHAAILLVLSGLYEGRDAGDVISPAVVSLLMRNRDPAMA